MIYEKERPPPQEKVLAFNTVKYFAVYPWIRSYNIDRTN